VQDGVHELTGSVAGERPSGAVGAVSAGSKSEDQDVSVRIAEAGYGACPILVIEVGTALFAPDLLAIFDQPRAATAAQQFLVKNS
jgi:hypothetical protein